MEYLKHLYKVISEFFGGEEGRPLLAWRIILVGFLMGVIAACISAYLVYRWSNSADTSIVKREQKNVSISDELLKEMVSVYEGKEKKFNELSGLKTPVESNEISTSTQLNISPMQ